LTLKVEGTLAELRELFMSGVKTELKKEAKEQGKKIVRRTKKRVKTAWQKFLKDFKFRKQKRGESNSAYFGARTKAASRAYKKLKPKAPRLPGQPRRR
jgi:hypothetical protein